MDKYDQYLLFALSAPMEVLYSGNKPSHSSPAMYTAIDHVDLSESWGITDRESLINTIYRMTDDGHASPLASLYNHWFMFTPAQWRQYIAQLNEQQRIYAQFVAETATCCGRSGIKAWDYVRMGFLCRMGVLNNWLTEEESLWLQSRVYARALYFYRDWIHYFTAYSLGRLYWQADAEEGFSAMQEYFTRLKYGRSGARMFDELASHVDSFYAALPWRPLAAQPECPDTLEKVSDL